MGPHHGFGRILVQNFFKTKKQNKNEVNVLSNPQCKKKKLCSRICIGKQETRVIGKPQVFGNIDGVLYQSSSLIEP